VLWVFFASYRPILPSPVAYREGTLAFGGGSRVTNMQRERITKMRGEGGSYARIAAALGISENTVKSFCRRNNLGRVGMGIASQAEGNLCRRCQSPLTHTVGAKEKRFCSDKCRMIWWNAHPEAVNRQTVHPFTCVHCGEHCQSYSKRNRKYCSRACYGKARALRHE